MLSHLGNFKLVFTFEVAVGVDMDAAERVGVVVFSQSVVVGCWSCQGTHC